MLFYQKGNNSKPEIAKGHNCYLIGSKFNQVISSSILSIPNIKALAVWKLKDPQTSNHFQEVFNLHESTSAGVADEATEDIWNNIKT